jgi:hypothetical protein
MGRGARPRFIIGFRVPPSISRVSQRKLDGRTPSLILSRANEKLSRALERSISVSTSPIARASCTSHPMKSIAKRRSSAQYLEFIKSSAFATDVRKRSSVRLPRDDWAKHALLYSNRITRRKFGLWRVSKARISRILIPFAHKPNLFATRALHAPRECISIDFLDRNLSPCRSSHSRSNSAI